MKHGENGIIEDTSTNFLIRVSMTSCYLNLIVKYVSILTQCDELENTIGSTHILQINLIFSIKTHTSYHELFTFKLNSKALNPINHGIFFPWLPRGGGQVLKF